MLFIDIEYKNKIMHIRLKGNLTKKNSKRINYYINPILEKHCIKKVIYNVHNLKDIDYFGIDALKRSKVIVKKNHGKIIICEANKNIKEKLKMIKVKILNSEEKAINLCEA